MRLERYDIFLSYIREDAGGWTGMLYRSLSDNLPTYRIFKDDEVTKAGTQWAQRLKQLVRRCDFFILVISKQWSSSEIKSALADPDNWIRREVETALASKRRIIPVLVNGAMLPTGLPTEIQTAIDDHQCFFFSRGTGQWDEEVNRLCMRITGEYRGRYFKEARTILIPDIAWIEIPAGDFIFGQGTDQKTQYLDTFWIGRYPITNSQYRTFIDAGGYEDDRWWADLKKPELQASRWNQPNRPKTNVNWYEAVAFTRWFSVILGYLNNEIRLPTEQEWEKAARGTQGRIYPWGKDYQSGYANIDETFNKA